MSDVRSMRWGREMKRGIVLVSAARIAGAAVRLTPVWVAAAVACAAAVEPGVDNLKASFAAQIDSIGSVSGVAQTGDTLTFTQTRADGTEVQWRVAIDSAVIEEPAVDGAPIQGHVVSSWYADGELIEPLGSMSRLPDAFLEAGIAQDCWALWDADAGRWGWT
ncbi:MAG: hypothetical protein F4X11_05275 [Acidobacteria bacterium]|nr:hypothetical protein [Acidobacteriota bacterium]